MALLRNEVTKFRRSHVWVIATLIPLIAVAIGAANYAANNDTLTPGWTAYFSQIFLFYGLTFMAVGIATVASSTWRFESKGHNWLTLMTSTRSTGALVASKIAGVMVVVTAMHLVLLFLALTVGFLLHVPGHPAPLHSAAALLALLPAAAVAAWQSFLSMVIRNFAAPIAIALVLCVLSFGAIASGSTAVSYVIPSGLLSSTIFLGSNAVADAGVVEPVTVATTIAASAISTGLGWFASVLYLRIADIRL